MQPDTLPSRIPHTIPSLNFARWSMAALVVIGHARDLIFRDAPQVMGLSLPWKAFYFATGFGHAAVVVFFVLSGFFVGGKLVETEGVGADAIRHYLIDRFSRIYIVLIPAVALTALLDATGATLSPIYGATGWSTSLPGPVAAALNLENFLASLFNVTMYVGAPLGSDGPLWSLAFEWVIYLMFPWLLRDGRALASWRLHRGIALRSGFFILLIALSPALGIWLVIWLAGVVARHWVTRADRAGGRSRPAVVAALGAAFLGLMAAERVHLLPDWSGDLLLGLAAAGLCAQIGVVAWRGAAGFHGFMAGFSFSLYVVHFPVVLFTVALLQAAGRLPARLQPGAEALGYFLGSVAVAYGTAWLFSTVTEARTHRLRLLLLKLPPLMPAKSV